MSEKIITYYGEEVDVSCIGCSLLNGELDASKFIIKEANDFLIAQDIEVPIPGLIAIGSKTHITSISEFSEMQLKELFNLIQQTVNSLKNILGLDTVNCFYIDTPSYHFHFSILPIYDWMKQYGSSLSATSDIFKHAKKHMTTEENMLEIKRVNNLLKEKLK